MSYLIFLACYVTGCVSFYHIGIHRERLRQNRGRVAVLRIAQKYHASKAAIINN